MAEMIQNFKREMLEAILTRLGKKKDVKGRIGAILNPDNPETSSILTRSQTIFMGNGQWIETAYPHAHSLKTHADHVGLSSLSTEGKGLDNAIKLETALNASRIPPALSIFNQPQQEQKKKRRFFRGKEREPNQ